MKRQMQKSIVVGVVAILALGGGWLIAYESGLMSSKISDAADAKDEIDRAPMKKKATLLEASLGREDELQSCYQNYLRTEPAVSEGMVEVDWMLDKTGKITAMEMVHSELGDETFNKCILAKIKRMTFRPPPQAKPTLVAHKFNFHKRTPASLDFKTAHDENASDE